MWKEYNVTHQYTSIKIFQNLEKQLEQKFNPQGDARRRPRGSPEYSLLESKLLWRSLHPSAEAVSLLITTQKEKTDHVSMSKSIVITPATHTVKSVEGKWENHPVDSRPAAVSKEALPCFMVLGISAQSHDLK